MSITNPGANPTVPPWSNANVQQLLPTGVAEDFIGVVEQESMALRLGRVMRMSAASESIPVVAFRPTAKFVNPQYGGRKPVTEIRWTAVEIRPEEIAATVPVPNAWIADANFNVEGQVERELANAVAYALDQAILFGVDAPASYPQGGVVAFADEVEHHDAIIAIGDAMGDLEGKGVLPDGIAAGASIGAALRAAYAENGDFATAPVQRIWGLPVARSLAWQPPPDAIVGGWNFLAIGIREDITYGRSTDGVLFNENGSVAASAFQDNVTLVKIYARIGCAIGMPAIAKPGPVQPQKPFCAAKWVGVDPPAGPGNGADTETRAARRK
jgi:hypothetical protein